MCERSARVSSLSQGPGEFSLCLSFLTAPRHGHVRIGVDRGAGALGPSLSPHPQQQGAQKERFLSLHSSRPCRPCATPCLWSVDPESRSTLLSGPLPLLFSPIPPPLSPLLILHSLPLFPVLLLRLLLLSLSRLVGSSGIENCF